ncbi:hypothetical protein ACFV84_36530 [Kitasatospora sp. NPDC059811]|uniref:hypothetical protein n=1 Tax=Streptomycetaceae TaxID=2062 RepID=UPI0007AF1A20|nr:hypothetical protein [Streptomyces sp. MJM8645]
MTSLHPAATDPSLPGPPGDSAGSAPPHAARCSIATAAETGPAGTPGAAPSGTAGGPRQAGGSRHDSVPQPRGREDGGADGGLAAAGGKAAADDPTTSRLRAALADRLRAARAQGRSVADLAAACRRPATEVRALLGESAEDGDGEDGEVREGGAGGAGVEHRGDVPGGGAEAVGGRTGAGAGRFGRPAVAPEGDRAVPVLRAAREELRAAGSRRPAPSRRLRRMHPQADATGQGAAARETAATEPIGTAPTTPVTSAALPAEVWAAAAPGSGELTGGTGAVTAPSAAAPEAARAETPLGILIGGSPNQPEAVGRPEERAPVRVTAEPVRIGRGTSLIVLPSWRAAIAVSVPTEQLLSATGLAFEQLADAQLTVLMNPCALHDRELDLHGWESGPGGRARRGGRP